MTNEQLKNNKKTNNTKQKNNIKSHSSSKTQKNVNPKTDKKKDNDMKIKTADIKKLEVSKTKEETVKIVENRPKRKTLYIDSNIRIVMFLIFIVVFMILGIVLLKKSFKFTKEETINYKENYNLDYKVYLKENDYFDTPYLDKNMNYISNLIKNIDITYNYSFDIDHDANISFYYYNYAVLEINDKDGRNYLSKKYNLNKSKTANLTNNKVAKIKENISIDYDYYNTLASEFKTKFGLTTSSVLKVYLSINKVNKDSTLNLNLGESKTFSIDIPLSEKSFNIKTNYSPTNEVSNVISESSVGVENKFNFIIASIFILAAFIIFICMLLFLNKIGLKKSIYDKYIDKLLREYDRLIVNTTTKPDLSKKVVKIREFNELLDVRDTVQMPIMYYEITRHQKCQFYINHDENIYVLTMKAVDMEIASEK